MCLCLTDLGAADAKPAASQMLSSSQTHPAVKAQTTAGILSKTTSTVMHKRLAHIPTMKVFGLSVFLSFRLLIIFLHVWVFGSFYSFIFKSVVSHFQSSSMKRPVIPTEFGAKVPTNIRQRYLNTFIDECVKFCSSEDVAFQMV